MDVPSLVLVLLLIVYAMFTLAPLGTLIRIGVAGAPFGVVLGAYNAAAFGSPFSSSYRYIGREQDHEVRRRDQPGVATLDCGVTREPWDRRAVTRAPTRGAADRR